MTYARLTKTTSLQEDDLARPGAGCLGLLRVLHDAPYLWVLPLHGSLVPASSAKIIAILFCRSQLSGTCGREWLYAAQSRHTSTPLLPTIEFP